VAYSTRTIGIVVASLIAAGLILTAVLFSGPLPFHLSRANAESTHDLLVSYAAKDSDSDGLPDWEEALYGTDPNNPHSVSPNVTDGEAVAQGLVKPQFATATTTPVDTKSLPGVDAGPQTLTDQFARQLFGQYLAQHANGQPTPEEIATFVEQGVANLQSNNAVPDTYTTSNARPSGSGPDALISYATSIDGVLSGAPQFPQSELDYFSDAVERGQTAELKQVRQIGASYSNMAKAYIALPVPKEALVPHTAVANAFARLGADITDMSTISTDPLRGYIGLAAYQNDAPRLITALAALDRVFEAENVHIADGTAGSAFYRAMTRAASVSTTTTP